MAEANFEGFVAGDGMSRSRSAGVMNVVGALTTLGLVVAAGVWGYKLAVRDASGVPVLQAMEGPIRVASENPGGTVARHVGLSVNRIAAEGTAGEVPEEIILAEPPLDLAEEDTPGIGAAAPAQVVDADTRARTLALAEQLASESPPLVSPEASAAAAASLAAASASDEDADPLANAIAAAVAVAVGGETASGDVTSIRPQPRPRAFVAAAAQPASLSAPAPAPAPAPAVNALTSVSSLGGDEIAAGDLRPGTRLAQIGAFEDVDAARQEWARIAARHPTLFEGKSRVIQSASSVGRTFYRLRVAGFESEDDSRRFCSAISSTDLRCITVTTR